MKPDTRALLQVGVHDAAQADVLFYELMGDEVAHRRKFIQNNASQVKTSTSDLGSIAGFGARNAWHPPARCRSTVRPGEARAAGHAVTCWFMPEQ